MQSHSRYCILESPARRRADWSWPASGRTASPAAAAARRLRRPLRRRQQPLPAAVAHRRRRLRGEKCMRWAHGDGGRMWAALASRPSFARAKLCRAKRVRALVHTRTHPKRQASTSPVPASGCTCSRLHMFPALNTKGYCSGCCRQRRLTQVGEPGRQRTRRQQGHVVSAPGP